MAEIGLCKWFYFFMSEKTATEKVSCTLADFLEILKTIHIGSVKVFNNRKVKLLITENNRKE